MKWPKIFGWKQKRITVCPLSFSGERAFVLGRVTFSNTRHFKIGEIIKFVSPDGDWLIRNDVEVTVEISL